MSLDEIKSYIKSHQIEDAVKYFLFRDNISAFNNSGKYNEYKEIVRGDHPNSELILLGGSGNWGYSFNPNKLFKPFSSSSDIDLVIVSEIDFNRLWERLRIFHRNNWYRIGLDNRESLRRSGENVYSGFITLKWIPDCNDQNRIAYEELANNYSNRLVGYRDVKIMYFKNKIELIDYYIRSFRIVRRS